VAQRGERSVVVTLLRRLAVLSNIRTLRVLAERQAEHDDRAHRELVR
jgi:hypothetical protein